jgi:SAM-dependent methyltransferase
MWNHNIHHHPVILNSVPVGTRRALDVGCGTGLLTRQLRQRVPDVVGVDRDAAAVEQARRLDPGGSITYLTADFFAPDWPPASFDLVASVAALHHMDAAAGLRRMRALLRPGGVLVVVGLAASELTDLPRDVLGAFVHRWSAHALRRPRPKTFRRRSGRRR